MSAEAEKRFGATYDLELTRVRAHADHFALVTVHAPGLTGAARVHTMYIYIVRDAGGDLVVSATDLSATRTREGIVIYVQRLVIVVVVTLGSCRALAQEAAREPAGEAASFRRHAIGTSAFVVFNALPDPPSFYQLDYRYHLTARDVLLVEAITWTYHAPLGIPYGSRYGAASEDYPGSIREWGVGLAYQRFLWRGLHAGLHATPFLRNYLDPEGRKLQDGFQLYLAARVGYHLGLFGGRLFVEPSVAATCWPIRTNVPASFAVHDDRWPSYFLFEPGLQVGASF